MNLVTSLSCCLIVAFSSLKAQTVSQYSGNDSTLDARWKWATEQSSHAGGVAEFWIGYGITRLMDEDSHILSGNISSGALERRNSLYSLLSGQKSGEANDARKSRFGHGSLIFKRMKDIALLFFLSRSPSGGPLIQKIDLCSMELGVNLKNKPLFWLGASSDDESVQRLEDTEVQRQALFALSQNTDKEGVDRLINVAKNHPNRRIRKQAIQILSQSDDPRALETLIEIVRK